MLTCKRYVGRFLYRFAANKKVIIIVTVIQKLKDRFCCCMNRYFLLAMLEIFREFYWKSQAGSYV